MKLLINFTERKQALLIIMILIANKANFEKDIDQYLAGPGGLHILTTMIWIMSRENTFN